MYYRNPISLIKFIYCYVTRYQASQFQVDFPEKSGTCYHYKGKVNCYLKWYLIIFQLQQVDKVHLVLRLCLKLMI